MLPCAHDRLRLPARGPTSSQGRAYFVDHRSQVTSWTDPRLSQQPQGQQQQQKPDVRGEFNDRSAGASMSATVTSATATAAAASSSSSSKPFKPTGTWVSSSGFGHARSSQACRLWVGDGVLARRLHVYAAVLALLLLVLLLFFTSHTSALP